MEKKRYILSKTKSSLVLELLRGSDIEVLSRRETITVSDLSSWRNEFIKNGEQGFKRNPEESKLLEAHRLIGQLQMELELRKKKSQLLTYLKNINMNVVKNTFLFFVFLCFSCNDSVQLKKEDVIKHDWIK